MAPQMNRRKALGAIGSIGALSLAGCSGPLGGGGTTTLTMMTSTEDTAAYQMSQGLAAVVNEESDSIEISARPGDGAKQSMRLLDQEEADIAYTDTLNASRIYNEAGDYSGDGAFSSTINQVFHYYDIQGGLATQGDSDIRTVNDLAGAAVSPNPVGTAMRDVMMEHLSHAEFNLDDMEQLALGYGEEAGALSEGRADVVTDIRINASLTPSYVEEQYSINENAWLLHWPDSAVSSIQDDAALTGSYYPAADIPGPDYGDRDEEWWTETVYVTFVRESMEDDVLGEVLDIMWENVESLTEYHALAGAWADESFLSGKMNPDIPVHPAAQSFYDDLGVDY
jgi:TRAP transporter TAXI family solute receptor